MIEFRCKWCGRLLSKICIEKGRIEIKCPNKECKRNKDKGINSYTVGYNKPLIIDGEVFIPDDRKKFPIR